MMDHAAWIAVPKAAPVRMRAKVRMRVVVSVMAFPKGTNESKDFSGRDGLPKIPPFYIGPGFLPIH